MPTCPDCGKILMYGPEKGPYTYYYCACGFRQDVFEAKPSPLQKIFDILEVLQKKSDSFWDGRYESGYKQALLDLKHKLQKEGWEVVYKEEEEG